MPETFTQRVSVCIHCGSQVMGGGDFCCHGCESVHSLLAAKGLSHFYTLKKQFPLPKAQKIAADNSKAVPLDLLQGQKTARFYLEGIQCLGCLWLLEKLPEIEPLIESAKLDMAQHILEIRTHTASVDWNEIGKLISQLGYTAKPLIYSSADKARQIDQHWQLIRIGLAAFCAGNIMLLSVSIYAGADTVWGLRFGWICFLLAIPPLTFSAWPIYKSGFAPLRHRRISVDLAISFALIAGFLMSCWSLLKNSERDLYFDSLSMLTFLLLSSRYLLSRFQESISKESSCLAYLSSEKYQRAFPLPGLVQPDAIAVADELKLLAGQTVPVDSILLCHEAYFDLSLLTGESLPMKFLAGDRIDAGTKLVSDFVDLKAVASAKESRLAQIMSQIRSYELSKSPSVALADRIGRYFVFVVLALAASLLLYFHNVEGVRRALALVIVTCPCVLAFAVPLAFIRTMQRAAKRGILFLAPEKIEALASVKNLFFDKTGTLTTGQFEVLDWIFFRQNKEEIRNAVFALEIRSAHPIAKSIIRQLRTPAAVSMVADFTEIPGLGISGIIGENEWRIGRSTCRVPDGKAAIDVWQDDEIVARIFLGDALRSDSKSSLLALQNLGIETHLLSGDNSVNTSAIAAETGALSWQASLLPEQKAEILKNSPHSAMIGDGANDAVAFRAASLGIAVQGAVELSLKNADIVLTKPGIGSVAEALILAKSAVRIVKINFLVTLTYNLIAGALAITGLMEPMWAAILMPMSALSVFMLTQWQTRGKLA